MDRVELQAFKLCGRNFRLFTQRILSQSWLYNIIILCYEKICHICGCKDYGTKVNALLFLFILFAVDLMTCQIIFIFDLILESLFLKIYHSCMRCSIMQSIFIWLLYLIYHILDVWESARATCHKRMQWHLGSSVRVWDDVMETCKFRNHSCLSLRCRKQRLNPKSIKHNSTIKGHKAEKKLLKAQTKLLRNRIRLIHFTIEVLPQN